MRAEPKTDTASVMSLSAANPAATSSRMRITRSGSSSAIGANPPDPKAHSNSSSRVEGLRGDNSGIAPMIARRRC